MSLHPKPWPEPAVLLTRRTEAENARLRQEIEDLRQREGR